MILTKRPNDPLLPRDYMDPTGLSSIRGAVVSKLNIRFNFIVREIKAYIKANINKTGSRAVNSQLLRYKINEVIQSDTNESVDSDITIYDYEFDNNQYDAWESFLRNLFYTALLGDNLSLDTYSQYYTPTTANWSGNWWLNRYIEQSGQKGVDEILQSIKRQSPVSLIGADIAKQIRSIDGDEYTGSPQYQSSLEIKQKDGYTMILGSIGATIASLTKSLLESIKGGLSKTKITNNVISKLIKSGGIRKRITNSIKDLLNNTKRDTGRETSTFINKSVFRRNKYEIRELWFSALLHKRTRKWHASRHGRIYTSLENITFYAQGGNRFNCYCHQMPIIVNVKTGIPINGTSLLKDMAKQKKAWLG